MKRQRWFFLGLILVLVFSWAPGAAAYSFLDIWCYGSADHWESGIVQPQIFSYSGGSFSYTFNLTAPEAGLFSQEVILTPSFQASYSTFGMYGRVYEIPPSPFTGSVIIPLHPASVNYYIYQLDQSGPTRFTDLSWEVKLLNNGSETTILSGSANADLIVNGGNQSGSGASFDYGNIVIPVEYTFTGYMGQPYDPRNGHYYLSGHGSGSDNKTVILSVTGHVIDTTVPASIEEILSLFDISVSNKTLTGEGPGNSADGRLKALRNMLTKVDELLAAGDTEEAYKQLLDAYKKIDGDSHIPDFVSGEATTELAQMILDLKTSLEQTTSLAFSTSATSQNPVPPTVWLLGSGLLGLAGWRKFRKINERFNQITISNELKKEGN